MSEESKENVANTTQDSTEACELNEDSSEEPSNTSQSIVEVDAALCNICLTSLWKYTCPSCETKTCSLVCVKEHKKRFDCTGERSKTEFVPKSDYSDKNLLNDYRFLEDVGRTLYSHKFVPQNKNICSNTAPYHLNKRSKLLINAANKRGVQLKMIPGVMKKHKSNTSFYTISVDKIDWHIEWHFVASSCLIPGERVSESEILFVAAQKHTNPVTFPHLRKPLEIYRKAGVNNCIFLLKVEGLPANRTRYFQLDPSATVAENMKGHSLVEHPIIFILASSDNLEQYPLLSPDDFCAMAPEYLKHLTRTHPSFKESGDLQAQVLDPNSDIYRKS